MSISIYQKGSNILYLDTL